MIFATDLDRTLIYSKTFLEATTIPYKQIEIYKGEPISYISIKALELLKKLYQEATIIPVTTRNYEQYHRIEVFKEGLVPKIYIINNGGTIYYKGQEDKRWSLQIKKQIEAMEASYEAVLESFLQTYKGPVERYKKSDDLIWLVLGDKEQIDWEAVKDFENRFAALGWRIDVNGRKIYLYPEFINKWAALDYVSKHYVKDEAIMAAGDSLFDYEMVHRAKVGIVPKESWIEGECKKHIYITQKAGLEAAEEILEKAILYIRENECCK